MRRDVVAVEEPLEIRVATPRGHEHQVAVTMRTPGDDFDLAVGFLLSEGLLGAPSDVTEIRYCTDVEPQEYNIVTVQLSSSAGFDPAQLTRNFYTTSSCGVCGKASLEALEFQCDPLAGNTLTVPREVVRLLPKTLRKDQTIFERTGGIHAAGLFLPDGTLDLLREDVGRHNALDKVIGHSFLRREVPLSGHMVGVSGRASFELMQKALVAGVPMLVAVGAPSSLAVDVAREFGMTLVGFTKDSGFNIYSGGQRVLSG